MVPAEGAPDTPAPREAHTGDHGAETPVAGTLAMDPDRAGASGDGNAGGGGAMDASVDSGQGSVMDAPAADSAAAGDGASGNGDAGDGGVTDAPVADGAQAADGTSEYGDAPPADADMAGAEHAPPADAHLPPELGAADVPAAGAKEAGGGEAMTMAELLLTEGDYMPGRFRRGDDVDGVVVRQDKDQWVLDIGTKQEAVVPANDLARIPPEKLAAIRVGDTVRGVILRPEGEVIVSLSQAQVGVDWERAEALMASSETIELPIVGHNTGGALVAFGQLQAFVPRSHLVTLPDRRPEGEAEDWRPIYGKTIHVKIVEVNRKKRRLIASERQAARESRSEQRRRLMDELQEGTTRSGTVTAVSDFGAFVDLGGADGLVHISELTHERGRHPRDVVQVGQRVEVLVLSVNPEKKRIALSMKRLQKDPWVTVEQDHYVGELVEAVITGLSKFGAFARLEDGLEGLIHISELSDQRVDQARDAVHPGQEVTAEIISINPQRQRIGLSIRRVPVQLRAPVPEHAPDGHEAADAPVAPAAKAKPAAKAPPIAEEAPVSDDAPDTAGAPRADVASTPAESPAAENPPGPDDAPAAEATPNPDDAPLAQATPDTDGAPDSAVTSESDDTPNPDDHPASESPPEPDDSADAQDSPATDAAADA